MFRLTGCGWWPFLGLFLFGLPLLFGHFGFGCHRTDPGTTTDPGVTTQNPTNLQALSAPAPSEPSLSPFALLLPLGGGIVAAATLLRARRAS